jgi:hypothetical protein
MSVLLVGKVDMSVLFQPPSDVLTQSPRKKTSEDRIGCDYPGSLPRFWHGCRFDGIHALSHAASLPHRPKEVNVTSKRMVESCQLEISTRQSLKANV